MSHADDALEVVLALLGVGVTVIAVSKGMRLDPRRRVAGILVLVVGCAVTAFALLGVAGLVMAS